MYILLTVGVREEHEKSINLTAVLGAETEAFEFCFKDLKMVRKERRKRQPTNDLARKVAYNFFSQMWALTDIRAERLQH